MTSPYEHGLDRTPANFQPLTPLTLLDRAARTWPDHLAIIHGRIRRSYAEAAARARRLASVLTQAGIGPGDTVSTMLSNTPEMLEAHHGVPITGAVLNTINTRLDAAIIAFILDHARARRKRDGNGDRNRRDRPRWDTDQRVLRQAGFYQRLQQLPVLTKALCGCRHERHRNWCRRVGVLRGKPVIK